MRLTISKSKNAESFYITHSFTNNEGKSTSKVIRKLGKLADLMQFLNTDRNGVIAWGKEQAALETQAYNQEHFEPKVLIPFNPNKQLEYNKKKFFEGGYLFLQDVYYALGFEQVTKKIKQKYKFKYDLNAILSDLLYTRILNPNSKRSSFKAAQNYLETPSYEMHDVYRALSILARECNFIQTEAYKNSNFITSRNDHILYYDCTNYYFEIEQAEGILQYGKSKEHRPNPIVQMGLFIDGDGIPLAFSLFPGNQNEQLSLKPLEKKVLQDFEHQKFIYCCDAGLGSEDNRVFNHMGERAFIVTQSIKKLRGEEKEWALNGKDFKSLNNDANVDLKEMLKYANEINGIFYKEIPYTTKRLHQRLIVTYSPKYAAYQKAIRERQIERAENMLANNKIKKEHKNPNDPARFIHKVAVTEDGEIAKTHYSFNQAKVETEAMYDGLYAICTDLLDDPVDEIIKVSEQRWRIEECFRIMKTEFEARPVYLQREERITAHFLTCFLALLIYRLLEKKLQGQFTCNEILNTLKNMNFVDVGEQGYMPTYERTEITDALHDVSNFRTDYEFISKSKMRTIQKQSKHH